MSKSLENLQYLKRLFGKNYDTIELVDKNGNITEFIKYPYDTTYFDDIEKSLKALEIIKERLKNQPPTIYENGKPFIDKFITDESGRVFINLEFTIKEWNGLLKEVLL